MGSDKPGLSILFLCTGNACRSQMAEGWAKHLFQFSLLASQFDIRIVSAGLEQHGLNPEAVAAMQAAGVDISGQTSDLLEEQVLAQADWVITLCDHANAHCPQVPSRVNRRHWRFADPAKVERDDERRQAFRVTRDAIKTALKDFIAELENAWLLNDEALQTLLPEFGPEAVEVARTPVYQGFLRVEQLQVRHRLFEGGWSPSFQRELLVKHPAVMVALYDPQRDKLVLIEQFRVGALADKRSPWLLEMVAGLVEPGESLEEVARRESLEEAGCEVLDLERIMSVWMTPGGCDERITLFCGRVDASSAAGVHGLDDEHEDIRVKVVSFDTALKALQAGLISNAASVIALQWLQLNKTALQQRWTALDTHS
ncbi:MAG: NUDIX domain-containing protein [Pseudomonadales bacterium]